VGLGEGEPLGDTGVGVAPADTGVGVAPAGLDGGTGVALGEAAAATLAEAAAAVAPGVAGTGVTVAGAGVGVVLAEAVVEGLSLVSVGSRVTVAPAWASSGAPVAIAVAEELLSRRAASSPRAMAPDLIIGHATGSGRPVVGGYFVRTRLGSSASWSPSAKKFMPTTTIVIARPGNSAYHGERYR